MTGTDTGTGCAMILLAGTLVIVAGVTLLVILLGGLLNHVLP